MVGVHVQNDADPRAELKEAVCVLAGLREEVLGLADADVAPDRGQDAAHGDRRVEPAGEHDHGVHAGRRGLAVGAGDRDGDRVVVHDLAEKLRPGEERKTCLLRCAKLRVIVMNGGRVDDGVDAGGDIFRLLADRDVRSE